MGEENIEIWRGFRHEWLRTVAGFRTPHRVSRLTSFVRDGLFSMGQSTGVDGNFMSPVGRLSRITTDRAISRSFPVSMAWTDEASGERYPSAESNVRRRVEVELDGLGLPPDATVGAILGGFSLRTRCDPAKQKGTSGNSDGMWPHHFELGVGDVEVRGGRASFPAWVTVGRSWTPNRGGVPYLIEKPFNSHLDFELDLVVTLVAGGAGFGFRRLEQAAWRGRGRDPGPAMHRRPVRAGAAAAAGLTSFGFELSRHRSGGIFGHRGRYLSTLDFGVELGGGEGREVCSIGQVGVPATVWDTNVDYRIGAALLEFDDATVVDEEVVGQICCPSSGAPWWSSWDGCGGRRGPARESVTIEPG